MITLNDLPEAEKKLVCSECKSKNIKKETVEFINHYPCEIQYTCKDCKTLVDYWAYGVFESEWWF